MVAGSTRVIEPVTRREGTSPRADAAAVPADLGPKMSKTAYRTR